MNGWGAERLFPQEKDRATWSHIIPFVAWLYLMQMLGDPSGWSYAVRSALCLVVFLWLRPWTWYPRLQVRNLPLAFGAGVLVFVAWVGLETVWVGEKLPGLKDFYLRWGVLPFGKAPPPLETLPFAPETCGWTFSLIRLAGSAFVISFIEEFFWRGFLYRWMMGRDFWRADLGAFDPPLFLAVAVFFGFEHAQWAAGIIAGLVYGWVFIRTRDIWATGIAHAITNFLLGWYVLATGAYGFW